MAPAPEPKWTESDEHFEFGVRDHVLVMRRLSTPLQSATSFLGSFLQAVEHGKRQPGLRAVLIDTRATTGQTNPEFERAIEEGQQRVVEHFDRMVVLVRSSVGAMQARRLSGEHLGAERIFVADDEQEAWRLAVG